MSEAIIDLTESSPPPVEQARVPSVQALLQSAIDSAQPARLRETLQVLCNSSADIARIASSLLLVPEKDIKREIRRETSSEADDSEEEDGDGDSDDSEDEDESENDTEEIASISNDLKRLRPRFAMCENCSEEFDVTDNQKKACVYHDGMHQDYRWNLTQGTAT